jgi:hypothetical protein
MQPCPNPRHRRNLHGPSPIRGFPLPHPPRLPQALLAATLAACSSSTGPTSVTGTWVETNSAAPLTFDLAQSGDSLTGTDVNLGYSLAGTYRRPRITISVLIPNWAAGGIPFSGRMLSNTEMKLSISTAGGDSADFVKQ